jgi:hypothetical protein
MPRPAASLRIEGRRGGTSPRPRPRIALIERLSAAQRARLAASPGLAHPPHRRAPDHGPAPAGAGADPARVAGRGRPRPRPARLLAAADPRPHRRGCAPRSPAARRFAARRARRSSSSARAAATCFSAGSPSPVSSRARRRRSASLMQSALQQSDRALAFGEEARDLAALAGTQAFQARLERRLAELPGPVLRPGDSSAPRRPPHYSPPGRGAPPQRHGRDFRRRGSMPAA